MISLDTLRADHLGIYGYHRDTSPSIDAFAKKSIVFENAVAQAPWTLPSHMSLMTSLYPSFHGVKYKNHRLAEKHLTLAELLRDGGYQTAAFADGLFMKGVYGFKQGFDIYDGDRLIGIAQILPKVKEWLDKNKSSPFFLFIHCYDIHEPYNPPPPYNSIFHDFEYYGQFIPNNKNMVAASRRGLEVSDEDLRHISSLYDGGIRYTDEKIGEFLSYLQDTGLEDNTLIIITSDHGEEFKEHGSFLHWKLYFRPNLHVPLIMRIPNYPKKEIRINELVQSIDVLPTILDIAELPPHQKAQGRSLYPLLKRHKNIVHHSLWQIFHPFRKDEETSFAEYQGIKEEGTQDYSIIADSYQMIYNSKSKSFQLFDLKDDPLAQNNIAKDHDNVLKKLFLEFDEMNNATPIYKAPTFILDEQTRKELEALGYVDAQDQTPYNSQNPDRDGILQDEDNSLLHKKTDQADTDGDGIADWRDNCPNIYNTQQENNDQDKRGDACDDCVDSDWDGYGDPGFPNTCEEDNCPPFFNPRQEDGDGDGIGNECDPSELEEHWLEAEHADSIVSPLEVANDENASKGKYIYAPDGTENQYTPSSIMAIYKVNISQAGAYILRGRASIPGGNNNSFFVQVDNGSDNLWDVGPGDYWHWDEVSNRDRADPVIFSLTEGVHTIKVKLREKGTKLDKLVLTNDIMTFLTRDKKKTKTVKKVKKAAKKTVKKAVRKKLQVPVAVESGDAIIQMVDSPNNTIIIELTNTVPVKVLQFIINGVEVTEVRSTIRTEKFYVKYNKENNKIIILPLPDEVIAPGTGSIAEIIYDKKDSASLSGINILK